MFRKFGILTPVLVIILSACTLPKAELGEPCQSYGTKKETCSEKDNVIETNNESRIVGKKVLLISDNQQALVTTQPIFEQSYASERTVNTAHRRPALDAFALDVMNYMIEESKADLIIHGGDLLNNSCVEEFKKAEKVLNQRKTPWFVVPGNHDGYYLGISSPTEHSKGFFENNFILDETAGWENVCTNLGTKVNDVAKYKNYANKATYVRLYLNSIGIVDYIRKNPSAKKAAQLIPPYTIVIPSHTSSYESDNGENHTYDVKCIQFPKGNKFKEYMTDVCWTEDQRYNLEGSVGDDGEIWGKRIEEEKYPWMNFVIQRLEVAFGETNKPTQIILIDTASYIGDTIKAGVTKEGKFSWRTNGAADVGFLSSAQLKIIEKWFEKDMDTIIFGHHPLYEFERESFVELSKILEARDEKRELRYISGDTHDGYNVEWPYKSVINGKRKFIHEINLGSTLDAPIEYAYLGNDEGNKIHLQHFSLTPVEDTGRWAKKGDLKKTRNDKPKKYVEFDETLWTDVCAAEFKSYEKAKKARDRHDPLLTKPINREVFGKGLSVPQANHWSVGFGLPYVVNMLSLRDVRENSLKAYKINRLRDLVEVYHKLFEQSNIKLSPEIVQSINVAENDFAALNDCTLCKYSSSRNSKNSEFNKTLDSLAIAIGLLETELDKHRSEKTVRNFMLCSAIYDAEREYKDSIL